jgi:hypothetical protein
LPAIISGFLDQNPDVMAYYKIINGIRYDRVLLEVAELQTQGRGEWQISLDEIKSIYGTATDGKKITETEWRTLRYIAQNFALTEPAKQWLAERFDTPDGLKDFEKLMQRIVRQEFGFTGLHWLISADEANRQNRNPLTVVDFPGALRQALRAFFMRGINHLSLEAVVSRRVSGEETPDETLKNVRDYMNGGATLFLVPFEVGRDKFDFDLPVFLNTEGFWYFGLHVPALSPVLFIAQGARSYQSDFYQTGYLSRRPDPQDLIFAVVRQLAQFTRLKWTIEPKEIARQLEMQAGQNFGEALFSALYIGIFNGESSFSFNDFIRQEVWVDPDRSLGDYMREYIETGHLYLLSPETGVSDFKIPENLIPDFGYNWVFGLEMPGRTDTRFVITATREPNLDASWNDGFLPEKIAFEEQIRRVVADEFNLPNLQITASEAEFEAQRVQFGPEYRTFSSLLRQALNTILHDYLNPQSAFNIVAQVHVEDVRADHFDDPLEYRKAIKHLILKYLNTGSLEFLPIELPDNNPVNGESIQQFWQFFGLLPDLADIGFWVIIPRFPDDGELPYCYGFN